MTKAKKKSKPYKIKDRNMRKLLAAIRSWHKNEATSDEHVEEKMRSFGMID